MGGKWHHVRVTLSSGLRERQMTSLEVQRDINGTAEEFSPAQNLFALGEIHPVYKDQTESSY